MSSCLFISLQLHHDTFQQLLARLPSFFAMCHLIANSTLCKLPLLEIILLFTECACVCVYTFEVPCLLQKEERREETVFITILISRTGWRTTYQVSTEHHCRNEDLHMLKRLYISCHTIKRTYINVGKK
jgi:hypothetical protein